MNAVASDQTQPVASPTPFIGPRPFELDDRDFFYGRESEVREVFGLVTANRACLIYAQSGVGKTSLLNAGLLPLLREDRFEVLPVARVYWVGPSSLSWEGIPNFYLFNTLMSLEGSRADPEDLKTLTLAGYLRKRKKETQDGRWEVPRILIFDQFEELFTFYPNRWQDRRAFFLQIQEALEGSPATLARDDLIDPLAFSRRLMDGTDPLYCGLRKTLSRETQERLAGIMTAGPTSDPTTQLLIDDLNALLQAGTIYRLYLEDPDLGDRLDALEKATPQNDLSRLNRLLLEDAFPQEIRKSEPGDPCLRVVFSMREDYIGELEPYLAQLPDRLRVRFRLEPLRRPAALHAIKDPVEQRSERSFSEGVAESLADDLFTTPSANQESPGFSAEFVDALQLQIVCQNLWEALEPEERIITHERRERSGDVTGALTNFYERAVITTLESFIDLREGVLRRWFSEKLINDLGKRVPVYEGQEETEGIPNEVVRHLCEKRILRERMLGGTRCYELTHDRFVPLIIEANQRWMFRYAADVEYRERLEERADRWKRSSPEHQEPLTPSVLVDTERWLETPAVADLGISDTLLAYINYSREQIRQKVSLKKRRQIALLTGSLSLMTVITVIAILGWRRALYNAENIKRESVRYQHLLNRYRSSQQVSAKLSKDKSTLAESYSLQTIKQARVENTALGIGISEHTVPIAWHTAKRNGFRFTMIRAVKIDKQNVRADKSFISNWQSAGKSLMRRSAVLSFHPLVGPQKQAELLFQLVDKAGGTDPRDLPPTVSISRMGDADPEQFTKSYNQCLRAVQGLSHRAPIIMTNPSFWSENIPDNARDDFRSYPVTVLHYYIDDPRPPDGFKTWSLWGYTPEGKVPGSRGYHELYKSRLPLDELFPS